MGRLQSENERDYSVLGPQALLHAERLPDAIGPASNNPLLPAGAIVDEPAGCQTSTLARRGQRMANLLGSQHLGSASWGPTGEITGTQAIGTQAVSRRHGCHRCAFMRRVPGPVKECRGGQASGRPAMRKFGRA